MPKMPQNLKCPKPSKAKQKNLPIEWCSILSELLSFKTFFCKRNTEITVHSKTLFELTSYFVLIWWKCYKTHFSPSSLTVRTGISRWGERLTTVDLLVKVAYFVEKVKTIFSVKSNWSELVTTRRSNVLSLPFSEASLVRINVRFHVMP
jgi:hypothetical protein